MGIGDSKVPEEAVMPALLFTAALATGQPSSQPLSAQAITVQDLAAVVSGVAPRALPVPAAPAAGTAPIALRQTGAGIVSTSIDSGANSVTQAATAVSARIVLPNLARTGAP
jgi:hypothetical protein